MQIKLAIDLERTTKRNVSRGNGVAINEEQRRALIKLMAQAIVVVRDQANVEPGHANGSEVEDVEQE